MEQTLNNKKIIFIAAIIVVMVLIFGIVFLLKIHKKPSTAVPSVSSQLLPASSPAGVVLSMNVPQTILTIVQTSIITANIEIDTKSNVILGTHLELSFAPAEFSSFSIGPGTFLKNPLIVNKNVDLARGNVVYTFGVSKGTAGARGKGVLAAITFAKTNPKDRLFIVFLSKTNITGAGVPANKSMLYQAVGIDKTF